MATNSTPQLEQSQPEAPQPQAQLSNHTSREEAPRQLQEAEGPQLVSLAEVRQLVRLVLWAALIGLGGWLALPTPWGVPLSLQTFFIVLAGLMEGPKKGALAVCLYLGAGLVGLPVFAGGLGGPSIIFRPSAGFALGFPFVALVAGLGAWKGASAAPRGQFFRAWALGVGGHLVMYIMGFVGLLLNTSMAPGPASLVVLSFAPGDLIKCAAAASLVTSRFFIRRN